MGRFSKRAEAPVWIGPLDFLGTVAQTDKSSIGHGYLESYAAFLHPYKNAAVNMIEIGVQDGYSLDLWQRYFSAATIVGIDIAPDCQKFANDRIRIRTGSQSDKEFVERVACEFPPSIVIDDGSHQAYDIITSLITIFPLLVSGGIYIIEDLNFHRPDRAAFHVGQADIGNPISLAENMLRRLLGGPPFPALHDALTTSLSDVAFITALPKALLIKKNDVKGASWQLIRKTTRCLVPESRDASLTREGEEALWQAVFMVQPGQRREFEPSSKRRKKRAAAWPSATA